MHYSTHRLTAYVTHVRVSSVQFSYVALYVFHRPRFT